MSTDDRDYLEETVRILNDYVEELEKAQDYWKAKAERLEATLAEFTRDEE